jgi:hypothetical protein
MKKSMICTFMIGLLLPLGCRSAGPDPGGPSLGPGSNASVYVLRSVAGDPLPAVLVDNEHATVVSIADTIWLEPDGTGVEVATERSTDKGTAHTVVHRDERPFTYQLQQGGIEVSFECNDVIIRSCSAPPHLRGVLREADLVLHSALYYRTPLEYERAQR